LGDKDGIQLRFNIWHGIGLLFWRNVEV